MLGVANRILLALIGAAAVLAATAVLTASWPFTGRRDPLLGESGRRHLHAEGWWWWAPAAGLAVAVVLALWWLLAQLRRSRLPSVLIDTGDGGYAVLRGRALEEAVAGECDALDGVASCRVRLHGRRDAPALRIVLRLEPYAVPADVLAALAGPVLDHARTSAGLPELPVEARLLVTAHHAPRVT
ncbi:alkaline shock response membrane anchor protein AmaP [Streptomyces antimicrobicus]|uniref:Alkaline shock response membrane anchor protein AmaP n=1 Tax=Streptomyces antimicrobicus TaxID=2883108 RepID=A0ABS8B9C5_9ACTN|nr:alkaline shock response membrane anchor protein AmaP [Streptomyces antimicrobicus]MCB5181215.1 alkaline shock response membrane anchor protein AmaP [Streptomyces antimicrobicus]